ncbi:bifunctional aminoglycoside phosphotransferase/ATP-binding protein [Geomesophilobacter sediminis]|uniref:AAA family ATPase n=1 Tax=Geomesophilobacter sediminis TaxID=2798584 RepID=A0A8J7M2E8_9BACT|nr:bifunctional aminoglycoside phosphotransferase/ATP-binding protein [Geomesophilobacter sediminis]MBJ6727485.1 AAA family ATPase [Geomesophilobacter sediminis]
MTPELIKALLKPAAYLESTGSVVLRQTHVSYLFLTDSFVYKVKKPVNFGFLNFSTVDRRRFYCEEEVRLNSRLSPELYLGVVELRQAPEGGAFHGSGAVIDYAVKMKRLPEERMLARLLEEGAVGAADLEAIARTLGAFHLEARRGPEIDACGTVAAVTRNWEENFREAAPFVGTTLPQGDLAVVRGYVDRFLHESGALIQDRLQKGFVRECDGDVHSANICLAERVYIFDCIEFNERFRYSDTAADTAFLLMDLEFSGRAELGAPFLATYRTVTGDDVPPRLLDFYRAYRAFVRGKVESLEAGDPQVPQAQREEARSRAERYFRLCRGYALRSALSPTLVLTCGLMGSGKSTFAAELAFELGCALYRGDVVRKELFTPRRAPEAYDGGIYTPECNRATYRELLSRAEQALAQGRSVVVDSTFRRKSDRHTFAELAKRHGARCVVVELTCDTETVRQRLLAREGNPDEVSDGRWELFAAQQAEYEAPETGEAIAVDGALPVRQVVDAALRKMGLLP